MKKIFYAKASYNKQEIKAVLKVLKNPYSLMDGINVKLFEKKISSLFGKKYGLMVNSGSSANLIGLECLNLKKKSEVITPLLTFSTTVAPIYQLGLIPHFIDVEKNKYVVNPQQIEKAINKNTSSIMIPNLLGNIANWKLIHKIAKKYGLKVIEDSADTVGYKVDNNKINGKYSDVVTSSFYASHIVTCAGFGGIVCFNDEKLFNKAKLLRGWGRSSALTNESEEINQRFNFKLEGINYDSKYVFKEFGYNFLPSEISAAFGLQQLKKLNSNIRTRRKNFNFIKNFIIKKMNNIFFVPEEYKGIKTGWLAFPLLIKNNSLDRKSLQIYLEKNFIQTRTIFTGNILKQPLMLRKKFKVIKSKSYIADEVMKNGILIGCHNSMTTSELEYLCKKIFDFAKKFTKNKII